MGDLVPLEMLDLSLDNSVSRTSDSHHVQVIRAWLTTFNNALVIVREYKGGDKKKVRRNLAS